MFLKCNFIVIYLPTYWIHWYWNMCIKPISADIQYRPSWFICLALIAIVHVWLHYQTIKDIRRYWIKLILLYFFILCPLTVSFAIFFYYQFEQWRELCSLSSFILNQPLKTLNRFRVSISVRIGLGALPERLWDGGQPFLWGGRGGGRRLCHVKQPLWQPHQHVAGGSPWRQGRGSTQRDHKA